MNALMIKVYRTAYNRLMTWLIGDRLWELAQNWVGIYEDKDIPSEEKRARVVNALLHEAGILSLEVATSLVNLAVEAAVQYLRRFAPARAE